MTRGFVKNIFGTLALAVADEMQLAVREASRHGASAPAALATLYADPGLSIEQLRHAVGVTHSGAVRLVDRLEEDGLVRREAGFGRRVSLHLTPAGERLATDVLQAREATIGRALAALTPADQRELAVMVDRMLRALAQSEEHAWQVCRLCDVDACPQDRCPIARALAD